MAEKKENRIDREGYYAVSAFLAILFSLLIHYFFIAKFTSLHSTIQAGIGIALFIIISSIFSALLRNIGS